MTSADHLTLGLRFVLELAALIFLAWWGLETGEGAVGRLALGAGVPLAAAALWGTFVAPRRPVEVSLPLRLLAELAVFAGAALALSEAWAPAPALIFAAAVVVSETLLALRPAAATAGREGVPGVARKVRPARA